MLIPIKTLCWMEPLSCTNHSRQILPAVLLSLRIPGKAFHGNQGAESQHMSENLQGSRSLSRALWTQRCSQGGGDCHCHHPTHTDPILHEKDGKSWKRFQPEVPFEIHDDPIWNFTAHISDQCSLAEMLLNTGFRTCIFLFKKKPKSTHTIHYSKKSALNLLNISPWESKNHGIMRLWTRNVFQEVHQ